MNARHGALIFHLQSRPRTPFLSHRKTLPLSLLLLNGSITQSRENQPGVGGWLCPRAAAGAAAWVRGGQDAARGVLLLSDTKKIPADTKSHMKCGSARLVERTLVSVDARVRAGRRRTACNMRKLDHGIGKGHVGRNRRRLGTSFCYNCMCPQLLRLPLR